MDKRRISGREVMVYDLNLKKEFEVFENDENHIVFFREFALDYLNIDINYVKEVMNVLVQICEKKSYKTAKHWCILYLGWVENMKGNLIEAIKCHKIAMDFFEKEQIKLGYGASYNALLVDYIQTGYLNLTIDNCIKCIKYCENLNNADLIVAVIINTILVFIEHEYYEEALFLLDRIKIYENDYRPDYEIEINIIKASCSLNDNKFNEVDKYCSVALFIVDENKFFSWKDKIYALQARKLYKLGNIIEGRKTFYEAIEISEKYEDKFVESKILIQMAICEYDAEDYEQAKDIFIKAISLIGDKEYLGLKEKAYFYLSEIYEKFGMYKKGYKCLKNHVKLKNIINKDSNLGIKDLKYRNVFSAAEEYKGLYNKIEKISNLCKSITSNLDIENCTDTIYKEVSELVAADLFGIAVYDENKETLNYITLFENNIKRTNVVCKLECTNNLASYCLKKKNHIIINDFQKEASMYEYKCKGYKNLENLSFKSIIYIPLVLENKSVGVMTVQSKKINAYSVNDLNELKILASYVAIAIKNLELFNKVRYFAEHDILTETYNRNKIITIGDEFNQKRCSNNLSIAMIDVDKFKSINDNYGHVTGDIILKNVCGIIQEYIGEDNFIGRYGGEEFLIIFKNKSGEEALKICEGFREEVKKFKNILEEDFYISISITVGVYEFEENVSFMEGVKKADDALYKGKHDGRNQSVLYK